MSALTQNNLGVAHELGGRLAEASECYAAAILLRPDWPDPHANLGNVLRKLGRPAEAKPHLRRALALNPNHAKAHNFVGIILYQDDRLAEAAARFRRAVELRPDDVEAYNNLGMVLTRLGDAPGAIAAFRRVLALRPDPYAHSALLFTLHYDPHALPAAIFSEHVSWARRYADPLRDQIRPHDIDPAPERRLRVGYVSADFREHTRSRFVEPVLAHHSREWFEIYCYSDVRTPDAVTARLRTMADGWREVADLADAQLADQVRRDGIDVLVDLTGHMAGHRLLAFARRPAPVQVTYPGYPNTTGLSAIDYCLTDPDRDPPGSESLYAERLVRLRPTSQSYEPTDADLEVGSPPHLDTGRVMFASLNKAIKVNPAVIRVWARILTFVPSSRLMLLANPGVEPRLLEGFAAEGIGGDRLDLLARLPRREYLELHRRIDVNLDPWPYNGHTTLLDGLWMGVPAVALEGDTHVSREGAAALRLIGLADLVARSPDEYALLAIRLACDLPRLAQLRATLRDRMRQSPLMNAAGLTRGIEAAYRRMWRERISAAAPKAS